MQDTQTALHHRNPKLQVSRSKSSTRLEARESQAEGLTSRSGFSPEKAWRLHIPWSTLLRVPKCCISHAQYSWKTNIFHSFILLLSNCSQRRQGWASVLYSPALNTFCCFLPPLYSRWELKALLSVHVFPRRLSHTCTSKQQGPS